ncbi:PepSY domain-containing protein [Brucella grignonensis]|uniref:Peptidase propeptide and YPEB domain protein n=1 Tax=Brucella grignonensis TaxID=94627 RepID=A0A256FRY1_9HYPH|nr:PepSY domain-containing protein [Brucella grignonensis]OYR17466.1 peptidase propeptide and YPEB domain protein [Brucella grignonensis]
MKKLMIIAASVLVAGIGAAGVTAASAANDGGAKDKAEMQALMGSKISITDAIKAAETAQPGKVAEAQFDLEKGAPAYEISIIAADGTEHDFMVDANTGKVEKRAANEDQNGAEENGVNGESEEGENG